MKTSSSRMNLQPHPLLSFRWKKLSITSIVLIKTSTAAVQCTWDATTSSLLTSLHFTNAFLCVIVFKNGRIRRSKITSDWGTDGWMVRRTDTTFYRDAKTKTKKEKNKREEEDERKKRREEMTKKMSWKGQSQSLFISDSHNWRYTKGKDIN